MELFVLRHAEWERLYNCSGIDIDKFPLERRRQFVPEAWLAICLCAIYYALYVPCLASIWRHCRHSPCYRLLFYIGIMDLAILWILGFLHGWLSLKGAVFCSHPVLIYWAGLGATAFWMAVSSANLILEFNRCLEISVPAIAQGLFAEKRVFLWIGMSMAYALYWLLFVKPVLFSSLHFAWLFYPFADYREDHQGEVYTVPLYFAHDFAVAVLSPLIYLLFSLAIVYKRYSYHAGGNFTIPQAQKMTFLQVFIVSFLNTVGCSLYVVTQYFTPSQLLITVGQFLWFHIHGLPPVIYLVFNKSIRNDCRQLLLKLLHRNSNTIRLNKKAILVSPSVAPISYQDNVQPKY